MRLEVIAKALDEFATPFYVFDETVFLSTVAHVLSALPFEVSLCYAMKANPFLVGCKCPLLERIEVCSPGEIHICQNANIPADQLVVSGIHKDPTLMRELMGSSPQVHRYTVESMRQFKLLEQVACELGVRIPILVRLSSGNQFGLDKEGVRTVLDKSARSSSVYPCGIQYYAGTQKSSAKRIQRELRLLDGFLEDVQRELSIELLELEYGAGLSVEYFASDRQVAREREDEQLQVLRESLGEMRFEGKIVIELGRALAASCGTYATRVVDTKQNDGFNYAIVDGGMHQIVYYGHAMSLQQPMWSVLSSHSHRGEGLWNIFGSLCTANDVLAKQIPCGKLQVGDVLLLHKAGAYCMTEGASLFLSRDLPRVLIASEHGALMRVRNRVETWMLNTWMEG